LKGAKFRNVSSPFQALLKISSLASHVELGSSSPGIKRYFAQRKRDKEESSERLISLQKNCCLTIHYSPFTSHILLSALLFGFAFSLLTFSQNVSFSFYTCTLKIER
ncbi:MAG: hypothetical protein ACO1NX_03640, partial [Chitinophagaceae bacterium]